MLHGLNRWSGERTQVDAETGRRLDRPEKTWRKGVNTPRCGYVEASMQCRGQWARGCTVRFNARSSPSGTDYWLSKHHYIPLLRGMTDLSAKSKAEVMLKRLRRMCGG
jgi:hypothetical protein